MTLPLITAGDETYLEMQAAVNGLVGMFASRYHLDEAEARSAANLGYAQACATYSLDAGTRFVTWVEWKVQSRLRDLVRQAAKRWARKEVGGLELDEFGGPAASEFDLEEWLGELSEDARTVATLVFDTPVDVTLSVRARGKETPHHFRLAVREFLKDAGWSVSRIRDTFQEIKEALS